jgi:hypothetical protein
MKPDMDEVEVWRLEARLRKAAAGHQPAAPSSLVSFVGMGPLRACGAADRNEGSGR